jgi:hypothetical protein
MYISPPEHLNFFSRPALVRLFDRGGFDLERLETMSKIPRRFVQKILRNPALTEVGWKGGFYVLRFFDFLGQGMVLNAYFRKREASEPLDRIRPAVLN